MSQTIKIFFVFLFLSLMEARAVTPTLVSRVKEKQRMEQWVDSVFLSLTPEQRIGQLFMPMVELKDSQKNLEYINTLLREQSIGGILFRKGSPLMQAELTNWAQSQSKVPLLISLDGEWGLSMRLEGTTRFPRNIALGAVDNDSLMEAYGREVGRQCKELGIHINFAPVLDVNSNPQNPVIGFRSFGSDPHKVAQLGIAYARGLESEGVMSVAKHFPGHGDTSEDSHETLPSVNRSRHELDKTELYPFNQYIQQGFGGMLTAHLFVPSVESKKVPSSMSPHVVTELLQHELQFEGLIFTDALEMKGAVVNGSPSVRAFLAGNDILLAAGPMKQEMEAMVAALEGGVITTEEVNRRCRKVLTYKYALGLSSVKPINKQPLMERLNSEEANYLNHQLTARSITVLQNKAELIPLKQLDKIRIASLSVSGGTNITPFQTALQQYGSVEAFQLPTMESKQTALIKQLAEYDLLVVGIHSTRNVPWEFFKKLPSHKRIIVILFASPFQAPKPMVQLTESADVALMAYENSLLAQECAAQVLFGGEKAGGKLPAPFGKWKMGHGMVTTKTRLGYDSPLRVGMNEKMLKTKIGEIIDEAIEAKAFPGCQVLVAKDGIVVYNHAFGYFDYANTHPITTTDLYDVASITKAAATVPAVMWLFDQKRFSLNDPIASYVPQMDRPDKKGITIRQLLFHESRLRDLSNLRDILLDESSITGPIYSKARTLNHRARIDTHLWGNRDVKYDPEMVQSTPGNGFTYQMARNLYVKPSLTDSVVQRISDLPLVPSRKYQYRDANFILLKTMVENLAHEPLDVLVEKKIYAKLGASEMLFNPLRHVRPERIAPTENDDFLRRQVLVGFVHDETAAIMGGVGGHAGLFSNANDLAKVCQWYLDQGSYGGEQIISRETMRMFTQSKSTISRRGLGFDKPELNPGAGPTSRLAPQSLYGHTGFTGTCFWVDPDHRLIFIFLSNRVYPDEWNRKITSMDIRTRIQDVVYQALD